MVSMRFAPLLPKYKPWLTASPVTMAGDASARERLLLGIGLVITSTVFLSAGDVTAKYLSNSLPVLQIAWMRYVGFLLILLPVVLVRGPSRLLRSSRPGLQILRGLGLLGSTLFFFSALPYLAIPELTSIFFIAPVLVTALSAPFLGETVGFQRWAAALVGFAGILIVVRPGTAAFQPAAVLPIIGALCWASALMFTRRLSGIDPPLTTLAFSALLGFVLLSAVVPLVWIPISWPQFVLGALIGIASTTGHWIVVLAYRHGDASLLSPYDRERSVHCISGAGATSWTDLSL